MHTNGRRHQGFSPPGRCIISRPPRTISRRRENWNDPPSYFQRGSDGTRKKLKKSLNNIHSRFHYNASSFSAVSTHRRHDDRRPSHTFPQRITPTQRALPSLKVKNSQNASQSTIPKSPAGLSRSSVVPAQMIDFSALPYTPFPTKNTSFEQLGITSPLLLANLRKSHVFLPTRTQNSLLPHLMATVTQANRFSSISNETKRIALHGDEGKLSASSHEEITESNLFSLSPRNSSSLPHSASLDTPLMRATILSAPTGTGKTLCYLLPHLQQLNPSLKAVQMLIVVPSRELAAQVAMVVRTLIYTSPTQKWDGASSTNFSSEGKTPSLSVGVVMGGTNIKHQLRVFGKRATVPQIVVATPGRLVALCQESRPFRFTQLKALILDEVDLLVALTSSSSFQKDMDILLGLCIGLPLYLLRNGLSSTSIKTQASKQKSLLFSWLPPFLPKLERLIPSSPPLLMVASATTPSQEALSHIFERYSLPSTAIQWEMFCGQPQRLPETLLHLCVYYEGNEEKLATLRKLLLAEPSPKHVLCFCNNPGTTEWVTEWLRQHTALSIGKLSGFVDKMERKTQLERLKRGELDILVVTEVAARGLDPPLLTHVVNFDLPTDSQHYIHRAGRVGRAGNPGIVISICPSRFRSIIRRFASELELQIHPVEIHDGKVWNLTRAEISGKKILKL
ncbi:DEAD/DEAH box helicase domain-containing protein [Cardiosporidium cionae]|uniref:RNA helicase n=1 Tax=Cardiosporidium cionae TaxID=476202 RepID=A0ABQ7JBY4_9APIC|nr:DEAD/DEAH box helicase domain-containing protein [Cardiosporidium cionae]|eukprot:KAF8821512.1 DEAD/DEAH box helicase domain-containing protein [Cardiosporidium cionae]